jgi:hypothetical protein
MKKKSIKHLSLRKNTVSKLNKHDISGGAPETLICPTPPVSRYCTFFNCGTQIRTCNSRQVCQTIEVDTLTRPIC